MTWSPLLTKDSSSCHFKSDIPVRLRNTHGLSYLAHSGWYLLILAYRLFQTFRSTVNRIKPFLKSKDPHLTDDPRLKDRSDGPTPRIYRPYPEYHSKEWKDSHRGAFVPCIGPRGVPVTENLDDQVSAYIGIPQGICPLSRSPCFHDPQSSLSASAQPSMT